MRITTNNAEEETVVKSWNEAIQTAIHQAKSICPDAKDLHDALEACLIQEGHRDPR